MHNSNYRINKRQHNYFVCQDITNLYLKPSSFGNTRNINESSQTTNIVDTKSLVVHPATTTHAQLSDSGLEAAGVTKNQIRISIGLEYVDDLIEDLRLALEKI